MRIEEKQKLKPTTNVKKRTLQKGVDVRKGRDDVKTDRDQTGSRGDFQRIEFKDLVQRSGGTKMTSRQLNRTHVENW
jgi:hypothetical protein